MPSNQQSQKVPPPLQHTPDSSAHGWQQQELLAFLGRISKTLQQASSAAQLHHNRAVQGIEHELAPSFMSELARCATVLEKAVYEYGLSSTEQDFLEKAAKGLGNPAHDEITVVQQPDRLLIRIPYLPRRGQGNKALVNTMLAQALRQYRLPTWKTWSAIFWHIYPATTNKMPWDVDNYDYKKTIDILTAALHTSDNALQFEMSMRSKITDEILPGTYIDISPKSLDFADFSEIQNGLK